jgi:HEAT repeat protein
LKPIDRAIIATQGDLAARRALEKMLAAALVGGLSRSAQDYVCRRLRIVGTAQSVPALAAMLPDEETSHIARYALERIPDEAAATALRDALPKVGTKLKPGMIGSLGVRRDQQSTKAIAEALGDPDIAVSRAAAQSLGLIGTSAAAKHLSAFANKASADMRLPTADALLVCAEQLLADGKKAEALALYRALNSDDQPTRVKLAAMKGMLAAAMKK